MRLEGAWAASSNAASLRRGAVTLWFIFWGSFVQASVTLPSEFVYEARGHFKQGGLVLIWLQPEIALEKDGLRVPVQDGFAVIGFGRDAPASTQLAFIERGRTVAVLDIPLARREYNIQRIEGVAPKFVRPPKREAARLAREGALKRAARADISYRKWASSGFQWPISGRISGVYGSQRFYNGEPRRPHFGIDIAAPAGTPVRPMTKGRVTLAEDNMYFEGGLVFIDHGLGVISVYMHLSEVAVRVGDIVQPHDIIGAVGSTGRSTGPHLDWRVFWRNQRIDPALLVGDMPRD